MSNNNFELQLNKKARDHKVINSKDHHIFIVWSKARTKETEIIDDLQKNLRIKYISDIQWTKKNMGDNFHRLYNFLPSGRPSQKSKEVGENSFLIIVVEDIKPQYGYRKDASGRLKIVNTKVVDLKNKYRSWFSDKYLIHSSDTPEEFQRNIGLFYSFDEISNILNSNFDMSKFNNSNRDLLGADEWASVNQLFSVLNICTEYLVLKSPKKIYPSAAKISGDIDILCSSKREFICVTNAKKINGYENFYKIKVSGEELLLDIREVGDGYFDINWQKDALSRREIYENRFFTLRPDDSFFFLLYHSSVHKKFDMGKYGLKLDKMSEILGSSFKHINFKNPNDRANILKGFFLANDYSFTMPDDQKVLINVDFACKLSQTNKILMLSYLFLHKVNVMPRNLINSSKRFLKKSPLMVSLVSFVRSIKF